MTALYKAFDAPIIAREINPFITTKISVFA